MTEIPEHLLKRSRERRAQLTGGTAEGAESSASAESAAESTPATPATTAPAAPMATGPAPRAAAAAAAGAPEPKPDSPVVAAAKRRQRIPFWAMAALSLMPLWGFMYVRSLTVQEGGAEGPLAVGTEVYTGSGCSGCHGGAGEGGTGRPFAGGEVLKTFPNIEDQIRFVYFGTEAYQAADVDIYGDPNREGGVHETNSFGIMPPQGEELTGAEILGVVCHERYDLGGADQTTEEYTEEFETWCSEESPIFAALEAEEYEITALGPDTAVDVDGNPLEDVIPIGEEPVEGSSADG